MWCLSSILSLSMGLLRQLTHHIPLPIILPINIHLNNFFLSSCLPLLQSLDLAHHLETSPSRSLAHPTSPSVISMSPLGRLNEIAASLRMLSPVRHQSEGGLNIGHHNDCTDLKSKANLSKTQGYPTSHSLIQSAFRFENFDAPVGPYTPDTAASRFRTESFATLPSRSDSMTEEGQELAPHDKVVVKDGFIYKKNTTGDWAGRVNVWTDFFSCRRSATILHPCPSLLPFLYTPYPFYPPLYLFPSLFICIPHFIHSCLPPCLPPI